jgi:hypothetical protein
MRVRGCSTWLRRSASSAGKAEMMAIRGVLSGAPGGVAQPPSARSRTATAEREEQDSSDAAQTAEGV